MIKEVGKRSRKYFHFVFFRGRLAQLKFDTFITCAFFQKNNVTEIMPEVCNANARTTHLTSSLTCILCHSASFTIMGKVMFTCEEFSRMDGINTIIG